MGDRMAWMNWSCWLLISWLACLLSLVGCSRPSSPEAEIRTWLAQAQAAAEQRDVSALRNLIAEDYVDKAGNDRKAIENLLRLQILRQQSIHLFTRVRTIEFPGPNRATVSVAAAMAGRPVARADDLVGLSADLYRFDLSLERRGGEWRVQGAVWEPARIDDFL